MIPWTFRSSYDELFLQILWGRSGDSSTSTNEMCCGIGQESYYSFVWHQISLEDIRKIFGRDQMEGLDYFQRL